MTDKLTEPMTELERFLKEDLANILDRCRDSERGIIEAVPFEVLLNHTLVDKYGINPEDWYLTSD